MTIHAVLIIYLIGIVCYLPSFCQSVDVGNIDKPNILWILAEDLSPDLGCYGHPIVYTPILDSLAAIGVRFTSMFTTAPVCTPSRTALATGMYQTTLNAHHMRYPEELKNDLPEEVIPLNELLRREGYQTANIIDPPGKGKEDWSFRSDIAHYDVNHWDEIKDDRPFFAVVNLRLTHRPFERDTLFPIDPADVEIPPYYPDHTVSRQDWKQYLETVQVMDREVGQVIQTLRRKNWTQNTIIFFFSDHGRPMTRAKNYHYDSGNHIPLIIHCPQKLKWEEHLPVGTIQPDLLSAIDITATTFAITGGEKPNWMQGRVFAGPQKEAERTHIYCASNRIGGTFFNTRSVRSHTYKYIRNFRHDFSVNSSATAYRKQMHPIYHLLNIYDEMGKLSSTQRALVEPMPEELLFNVKKDSFEIYNLASNPAYAEVLEKMRAELRNWQQETKDHGMKEDSDAIIQAFENYKRSSHETRADKIQANEEIVRASILQQRDH